MAYESFPNNAHNNRVVTLAEHEQITLGFGGLSGLLRYDGSAPLFADSTGLQVKIQVGVAASIRGTRFNNTTTTVVGIGTNTSGNTRVDLVVLRLRRQETSLGAGNQFTIAPHVIQGTPGSSPVAPAPVRDPSPVAGFWDVPLGEVTVPHNATTIAASQVKLRTYWITGSGYTGSYALGLPPAEPGLLFRAEDTGVSYIGTLGGAWQRIYEDTGWVAAEVGTSWSVQGTGAARVRLRNGEVFLQLDLFRVGGPLSGGAEIVAAVPEGFAPDREIILTGAMNVGGHSVRFSVRPDRGVWIDGYPSALVTGRAISVASPYPLDERWN